MRSISIAPRGARGDINPTTLRFSRRAGEAYRGCDYAQSIEAPRSTRGRGASAMGTAVAGVVALLSIAAFLLAH
jgi:hypothetical protein